MPIAMAGFALVTYIPTFYAEDLGLGLGAVGFIFVIGRLLDVATDPIIGHLSDRTQTGFGPRRPWMVLGVPLFCLSTWLLFTPIESPNLLYLIGFSAAYFLFYTMLDVPYSSVGLEISSHIHERSTLASTKAVFQVFGAIFAAILPVIFALKTANYLEILTQIIIVLSILFLLLFLKFVPMRNLESAHTHPRFLLSVKTSWNNPIYSRLIFVFFIIQTANALLAALTVLYVRNILQTPDLTGLFLGILFLSSALFLPVWIWLSKVRSKKYAWACSIVMTLCVLPIAFFLREGDIYPTILFSLFMGAAFGCDAIMPTSMLADIVHKHQTDGKGPTAALYLAMKNSVSKLTFIVPMGLAFPVLEKVGLASGAVNSSFALISLLLFYAGLPLILRLTALFILRKLPKTETLFQQC